MDQTFDRRRLPVEIILLVADLPYRIPRHLDQVFAGDRRGTPYFPGQHHAVGRDQRFDAATSLRFGRQESVDNRVGDAVANFVGVSLRHGFARKNLIPVG